MGLGLRRFGLERRLGDTDLRLLRASRARNQERCQSARRDDCGADVHGDAIPGYPAQQGSAQRLIKPFDGESLWSPASVLYSRCVQ